MKSWKNNLCGRLICTAIAFCLSFSLLSACDGGKKTAETYTYTNYITSNPTTWNPHTYSSESEATIHQYISDSLLTLSLNSQKTGFDVTPSLARILPTDVSNTYKGKSGVPADATSGDGYAWRFDLRTSKWADGTAINADTFEYSLKMLLDNSMNNPRSADFTSGKAEIYNAKNYLNSGMSTYYRAVTDNLMGFHPDAMKTGAVLFFSWDVPLPAILIKYFNEEMGYNVESWRDAYNAMPELFLLKLSDDSDELTDIFVKWQQVVDNEGGENIFFAVNESGNTSLKVMLDEDTYKEFQNDSVRLIKKWLLNPSAGDESGYYLGFRGVLEGYSQIYDYYQIYGDWALNIIDIAFEDGWTYELFLGVMSSSSQTYTWANVGFKRQSEFVFDVIFVNPLRTVFDVAYYFASKPFLVHKELYESLMTTTEGGAVRTTYGTTPETTMSYGPYTVKEHSVNQSIHLVKNENWSGYTLSVYNNQYQTTDIELKIGLNQPDALSEFKRGNLSEVNLSNADLDSYASSDNLRLSPNASTTKLVLNSDRATLEELQQQEGANVNKLLMSYKSFRQAISLSFDRNEFARISSTTSSATFGIINNYYVSDAMQNVNYRKEMLAKLTLVATYNPAIGDSYQDPTSPWNPSNFLANLDNTVTGESYTYAERVNSLHESITGKNFEEAKRLFLLAFSQALAAGDYTSSQTVIIDLVSESALPSSTFIAQAEFIQTSINDILASTSYAGKVEIRTSGSTSPNLFLRNLRMGKIDAAIVTSNGNLFSPFTLLNDSYLDSSNRYEYGMNPEITKSIMISLKMNNYTTELSLWHWAASLKGPTEILVYEENYPDEPYLDYVDCSKENYSAKMLIASAIEYYWLNEACSIPLSTSYSGLLVSEQINLGADEYISGIGFGGVRYITYNYSDQGWAGYVKTTSNPNG